ncbi:amidohydrolase family protein [Nocardioides sp. KIGAM211]|uniref:Amidohydrolase family protein n=1 Tax=Nocardioides luti TaxID=2761101 RepID=A0A7X0RCJ2_9ACTN|nr:amidohydrolase family protein [Nocardioides luti]MBB6625822.1 amidohydrolase family protein [Nocardioides luti]
MTAGSAGESLLLRNARVYDGGPGSTAVAVRDGRIAFVGDDDAAAAHAGGAELDLGGALVTAAFVDTHVHTVRTGFALTGLDLTGSPSLRHTLDALAAHAAVTPEAGVLVGQGWDETGWPEGRVPTGDELERAAPGRRSYLTRVDGHSSVISPVLAALVPGLDQLDGWTTDGRVERDAHHAVRNVLEGLIGPDDRLAAARAACRAMAAQGIVGFHENAAPHIGPETEIEVVRRVAAEVGLRATAYWGELLAVDTAARLGVAGLAGDLVADGAFGSRTAALSTPYTDRDQTCGHAYVTADQVRDHVVACTEAGLQAGFHCIGDAALTAIDEGLCAAEAVLGAERIRAARHRLEHVEMPAPHMVATMARLGVVASVQPMFDALWSGPDGMYAARLGERWRDTNPFADLAAGGVRLSFGSDSPVTPLGPWAAIRAAVHHQAPGQGLSPAQAFHAHTRGGTYAARDDEGGLLRVGQRADLAVWDVPGGLAADGLPDLTPGGDLPVLRRLLASGRTIHDSEETHP